MAGSGGVVRLNVGGTVYTTTVSTVTKHPTSLLGEFFTRRCQQTTVSNGVSGSEEGCQTIIPRDKDTYFIDRDGLLFRYVLNYLRTGSVRLQSTFPELESLIQEASFFRLTALEKELQTLTGGRIAEKERNGDREGVGERDTGHITIAYRGTFGSGRSYGDAKFRKIGRILVCGRATLCKEVFGNTLNDSRDPDRVGENRYTSRMFLKHNSLELAFDTLGERNFRLITCCGAGASSSWVPGTRIDGEEQKWSHYNEFVFARN